IGAPVEYLPHKKGYCYSLPFDYFTYRNERMLLFYIFLTRLIESPTHFPFIDRTIIDSIKKSLKSSYLPLINRITYEIEEWEALNIELFSKLFAAMRDGLFVSIQYADVKGNVTIRAIAPEHFIHYEGRWYCIAYDDSKKGVRTFLLSRIKKAQVQNRKRTKRLSTEEIQKYIQSTYGIYKGKTGSTVCIRFYEPVSNIVKKQVWHKHQTIREGKHPQFGTYIDMLLPVHHPQELLGKVLRYGKYAEIVSPKNIRKQWLVAIEEAYTRYCEKKK
ncbi:MAG: WYL domain-containing protein, partial [Spirochaetes bacterium]|nr:WYL domain-containing protein [Spirochaetota bacterium]